MRIREDSPFFGISEEQKEKFLDEAENLSYIRIAEMWEMRSGKHTTEGQVKRFLQRLRYERSIRDTDDSQKDWASFAERARDGKARDGLIEAARQKLFEEALASGDRNLLLELYKAANDERAREREVVVARRKAAVAEENAMIGWAKVPGGRPMQLLAAQVAEPQAMIEGREMRLLEAPKLRELLADSAKPAEERIAAALGQLNDGPKLLAEGSGAAHSERPAESAAEREEKAEKAAAAKIEWDAPLKALMEEMPFAHWFAEEEAPKKGAEEAKKGGA